MGFLRKRGPKPAEVTQYTGLQIQTSSNAVPIAIVYGTNKVAPNLLWHGEFGSIPEYTKTGGKGGGRQSLSGYRYHSALTLGLCEGPITAIGAVWKDKGIYAPWQLGLWIRHGNVPDPVSAYSQDIGYKGVACVESAYYDLGSTASIGSLQFEIRGQKCNTAEVNADDADPADVIYDFLTNEQYGVGFPAASIHAPSLFGPSGGASYQAYCRAVGIGISPVIANRETANAILTRWLQLTNSTAIWSEGKLKFLPYGDARVEGVTPASYISNVLPLYDLTDDDFIGGDVDDDPILVERQDESSIFNVQQMEISDRSYGYNSATVTVWDQNSIEEFRRRDGATVTAHEVCDRVIAQKVAQLILQRGVYIRNTYSFKLSFAFCLLEPMDIVTLTDAALGMERVAVRIVSIEEDDDGALKVVAEEYPGSIGSAVAYPVQGNSSLVIDRNIIPSAVNAPLIFEPPAVMTGGEREIWAAISGGLASTRRLEEDASTGYHHVRVTLPIQSAETVVSVSAYVLADERSAVVLGIFDGLSDRGATFELGAGKLFGASVGVLATSITPIPGGAWFQVSISCAMATTAAPRATISLESVPGTDFYAGSPGHGLYVWNVMFGVQGAPPSILAIPMVPSGATFEPHAQDPPLGVEGTGDPYWGGCIVHASTDGTTFGRIGLVNGPARHGKVTGCIGSVLSVSLVECRGTLEPASPNEAENGITLSLVGNELVAYGGAMLTGSYAYDLCDLTRGLYGTTTSEHMAGERFARLDDSIFKYTIPAAYVGQTLYLKFQSFNCFGEGLQDLATCATYTYTPTGVGEGLGPILSLLAAGVDVDLGRITESVLFEEDLGPITVPTSPDVDLGDL
jgi:hypothetical protein